MIGHPVVMLLSLESRLIAGLYGSILFEGPASFEKGTHQMMKNTWQSPPTSER